MASTYSFNPGRQSENEHTNAYEGMAPSQSTSATSSVGSLFSRCFGCCSHSLSMPSVQPNSMVSMSTTNASEGMAPSQSTSATSSMGNGTLPYDVFINHFITDVKQSIATTLYYHLTGMGLRVFLHWYEDQVVDEVGDLLPTEIEEVIRSAWIHISIFSRNYAYSRRCLSELSFMLKIGIQIVPIFYGCQPDDVRCVSGMYADAFSRHEQKGRDALEKLQEWKQAFKHVPYHLGEIVRDYRDQRRVFETIGNRVLKLKRNVPSVIGKYPVGLDETVVDFQRTTLQSAESHRTVQIVGIWGMAGSGKTTLAKQLYNTKSTTMERCSFMFDVRDASKKSLLIYKQKKLIEDLGAQDVSFDNIEQGKQILASRLSSVRVLLVLDDVDNVDQLDALIPEKASLGRGSLIVVTTREVSVLQSWGISSIYKMKILNDTHAKELFCWHAFLQPTPRSGFEDLVEKFLRICQGLPLSLKVLGGQLYGKNNRDYWKRELNKISRTLPNDIKSRLKVSYDDLDDEEKHMFLDIACFLIGEKKSLAIAIWDHHEWAGRGLRCLVNLMSKCLIEVDQQSFIRMQGPLMDLGREIANEQPPYRLWSSTQTHLIKEHAEETLEIRGIMAAITQFSSCSAHHEFPIYFSPWQPPFEECSKIMQNSISRSPPGRPLSLGLKFLVVTGDDFSRKFAKLSEELIWLRWFDFKHTKLPSWLSLENLRILELYGATTLKELWEDGMHPPFLQLTELNITCSWGSCLQRFPSSISDLKHLKKIALIGYLGDEFPIKRLPEEFCDLEKLEHLELRHCRVLSSLPSRFGELKMLRHIDLSYCVELRILPVSFKQLEHLEYLDLSGCRKLTFRLDFLENISKLEKLDFSGCRRLQVLPERITSQGYLRQLNMRGTRLRNMPREIGELRNLENLQISSPFLTDLPSSLGDLSSLTRLTIFDCPNLKDLPDSMESLKSLEYLCIECSGVDCLPKSFRNLANLQTLEISGCPITEFDFGEGSSSSSCMRSLKVLHIADTQVSRVSIFDDCCPVLQTLQLTQNEFLVEIVSLPRSLEVIELWECERLKDITCIHGLPNLKIKNIQIKISGYQS